MLSPRWRKVASDLWGNRLRTILVVLSVAVGVFAVGLTATAYVAFTTDLNQTYAATKPAHATISADNIGAEAVRMARGVPGVAEAEGRRTVTLQVQDASGKWRDLELNALADFQDVRISLIRPQQGAWPPPRHAVLLERASQAFLGKGPGDTLLLRLPGNKYREVHIAGIVHDIGEPSAVFANRASCFTTVSTMNWLGYGRSYNNLLLRMDAAHAQNVESIRQVATIVADKLKNGGYKVGWTRVPEPGKHPIDDILRPLILLLGTLGFMALVLSGFLVVNTITAVIAQQLRQIGIMKAIGGTRSQIMGIYFGMVFVFCVLALIVAIPAGSMGGRALSRFMATMLNFDMRGGRIPWQVLVLQIGIGFLVPYGAAIWPIWSGTGVTAREALSSTGISADHSGGRFWGVLWSRLRLLSRPVLISLRNTFRRKGRLALTLITLSLAGAIFMAVLSVQASLYQTIDDAMRYQNFDVQVSFNRVYRIKQLVEATMAVPGVATAQSWGNYAARRLRPDGVEGDSINIVGLPIPTDFLRPFLLQGRWLLPEDEDALVINTDVLKTEPDIRVGDRVTLTVAGRELDWYVVGIVRGVLSGRTAYANYPYIAEATRGVGRAGSVLVRGQNRDLQHQEALARQLERTLRDQGFQVRTVRSIGEDRHMIKDQLDILIVFLLIMAVLLAVVGGLGLMGTMSIGVLERTREIGVMRAVGASNSAVAAVFLREGVFIGLLSWLIGGVLAWPAAILLSKMVGNATLRAPLSFTFSWAGVAMWLLISASLAVLASLLPSLKAARMTVRDVLAYE